VMAATFAVVGLLFLFWPDSAIGFFNRLSGRLGLPEALLQGAGFYLILASAYMYIVTLLALSMYRFPENDIYPSLLAHAKLASSLLSIYLFVAHRQYLIYLANFIVDGFIGTWVVYVTKLRRARA
jgi:hypothetical protein